MAPPRPLASASQDLITALQRQNEGLKFTINNARTTILNTADNALAKVLVTVGGAVAGLKAEFEMKMDRDGLKCLADIVTKSTRAVGVARGDLGAVRVGLEGVRLTVEEWKENPIDADVGHSAAEKRKLDLEDDTVDLDLNPRGEKRIRSLSDELEEGEVLSRQGSDHEIGIGLLDPRVWGAGRNTWDIGTQTPADWLLLPTEEEEGFIGLPRNFEKWAQQSAQPLQVNKSDEDKYIPIKAGRPQAGLAAIQVPLRPVAKMVYQIHPFQCCKANSGHRSRNPT